MRNRRRANGRQQGEINQPVREAAQRAGGGDAERSEIGDDFGHKHQSGRVVRIEQQSTGGDPGRAPSQSGGPEPWRIVGRKGVVRRRVRLAPATDGEPAEEVDQGEQLNDGVSAGFGAVEGEPRVERRERGGEQRRTDQTGESARDEVGQPGDREAGEQRRQPQPPRVGRRVTGCRAACREPWQVEPQRRLIAGPRVLGKLRSALADDPAGMQFIDPQRLAGQRPTEGDGEQGDKEQGGASRG